MKKASTVFLLITAMFICVMVGTLIGRYTAGNVYTVPAADISAQATTGETVASGKLNINTASLSQLSDLPDIGPVLAQRIIDYRMKYGDFETIDELLNVEGIGEKRLETIRELITTGG